MLHEYKRKRNFANKGKKAAFPKPFAPMLAKLVKTPFTKPDWIFEPKLDGIRALSYIQNGKANMLSRRGLNLNHRYPAINQELADMDERLILDGEIVALDAEGKPSFQLLQQHDELSATAAKKVQIIYYVFDILYYKDRDLRGLSLNDRQNVLRHVLSSGESVKVVESLNCDGKQAFQICLDKGLEGIVAKYAQGIYEPGRRSENWLKVKVTQSAEFIICGYNPGTGSRKSTFGSLLLGYYDNSGELIYAGNVGTGFNAQLLAKLKKLMKPLERKTSPFKEKVPNGRLVTWLTPELVAEIKYAEITQDKKLRVPVFMRLREDIDLHQTGPTPVVKAVPATVAQSIEEPKTDELIRTHLLDQSENVNLLVAGNSIKITNLDKILWPGNTKTGPLTKRDYLLYLLDMAPILLPHLKDRPITLIRYPSGLSGQRFFQKHWNQNRPSFVDTVEYYSEHNDTDEEYLICNNLSTLLWFGQMSSLELHTAHSRVNPEPDLNHPDFIVFDLDPYVYSGKEAKGAEPELNSKGFAKVKKVAFWLKEVLDQIGIKSYLKTSGRTGLHIYIPIVRNVEYERIRAVARILGEYLVSAHGADITVEWAVSKRTGKIFFDYNMNARGKTLACPYSPRSTAEACVSAPIEWSELSDIYPDDFTITNMFERIAEKGDLWSDILDNKNDLHVLLSSKKMNILNLVPKKT
ncbi:MAG: DNA ligase D [Candidatus Obscuribacterales bacterium]|nr:DNA ligase D [Candidatus Obscuribacterales bacterium]